jgi:hypothetical protein
MLTLPVFFDWGMVGISCRFALQPAHAGGTELFCDLILRDALADHGESFHWQCAHCNDSNVNLP